MSRLDEIRARIHAVVGQEDSGADIPIDGYGNAYDCWADNGVEDAKRLLAVVDAIIAVRSDHGLERAVRQVGFAALVQPKGRFRDALFQLESALEELT